MTTTADKDLTSIGVLASHVQRPVREITEAAERLQLAPALKLNGVPHWDATQVAALTRELRSTQPTSEEMAR